MLGHRAAVGRNTGVVRTNGQIIALFGLLLMVRPALAEDVVGVFVLKEHGIGTAAQAQPYLERFVELAAKLNGWSSARGRFFATRVAAEPVIASEKPHYGIFSLAAFLSLRRKYELEVVGKVDVWRSGGKQYHIITKDEQSFAACRNKKLASDHTDDQRFIEKVVARGAFKLSDFQLKQTTRPLQTIKAVLNNDADCALIDDAQLEEVGHIEDGGKLKILWSSTQMPPMVMVAFPLASVEERKKLQDSMQQICEGEAKLACNEVGILSLAPATDKDYQSVIKAYGG